MSLKPPKRKDYYLEPSNDDIIRSYINRNSYNRADARRIKRQLRRLAWL